ncbi:MAG: chemotaxis protein CheD [Pseudomonadota bacterium]
METKLIQIGGYHITVKPMMMRTLLGSCVAICVYNKTNGHAAMNHFLLPSAKIIEMRNNPGRYGQSSCELIIRSLMRNDPDPSHYTAQVFGGAKMFGIQGSIGEIGNLNIELAKQIVKKYKIPIIHHDTGGTKGRKILFNTEENRVESQELGDNIDFKTLKMQHRKAFKRIEEIYLRFPKA